MRNVSLALLFTLFLTSSFAQVITDVTYGGVEPRFGRDIEPANTGYMISTPVDGGWINTRLFRINENCDTLWTRNFGSDSVQYKTFEMITSSDGGYILCGDYQQLSTFPNMDSYIMKVDSLGHILWFNKFGIPYEVGGNKDYANNVIELTDGRMIVAGNAKYCYSDSSGYLNWTLFQGYVGLLDTIGNPIRMRSMVYMYQDDTATWQRRFFPTDLARNGSKVMIVSERTSGWGPPYGSFGHAVIVDSNLDTVKSFDFPVNNIVVGASVTHDNAFLIAGDSLLAKIDTMGTVLWQRNLNLPFRTFTEVLERTDGKIAVLQSANAWYMQSDVFYGQTPNSAQGVVIIHLYDTTGIWLKSDTLSTSLNGSRGIADFTVTSDNLYTLVGSSGNRAWILQFCDSCSVTSMVEQETNDQVELYPNPCNGYLTINGIEGYDFIQVYSVHGQLVSSDKIDVNSGSTQIDVTNLTGGVYFLQLTGEDMDAKSLKFIRE